MTSLSQFLSDSKLKLDFLLEFGFRLVDMEEDPTGVRGEDVISYSDGTVEIVIYRRSYDSAVSCYFRPDNSVLTEVYLDEYIKTSGNSFSFNNQKDALEQVEDIAYALRSQASDILQGDTSLLKKILNHRIDSQNSLEELQRKSALTHETGEGFEILEVPNTKEILEEEFDDSSKNKTMWVVNYFKFDKFSLQSVHPDYESAKESVVRFHNATTR